VAILRYAKWPVFIWALWDVVIGRRVPYAITRKLDHEQRSYLLLISHVLIILSVVVSWVAGLLLRKQVSPILYWAAALIAAASILLILTDQLHFPMSYDKKLLPNRQSGATISPPESQPLTKAVRR
jgi:hypothetical protein